MDKEDEKTLNLLGGILTDVLNQMPGRNIAQVLAKEANAAMDHIASRMQKIPELSTALANSQQAALKMAQGENVEGKTLKMPPRIRMPEA